MNLLRYFFLRYRKDRDEKFLLRESIRKAKEQKLELEIGKEVLTLNNSRGILHLHENEDGIDVRNLMALVANDYPVIVRRYFDNIEKLKCYE